MQSAQSVNIFTRSRNKLNEYLKIAWVPYVAPFVLFLLLTEPARHFPALSPYLYILKTFLVGALLWYWRAKYKEDLSAKLTGAEMLSAICCGLLVLVIWIVPENYLFKVGESTPFNPQALGDSSAAAMVFIAVRLLGSSLVVPVMEELFWRSFLMRYLVNPDFRLVTMGTFSWFSFLGTALFFGAEHHRIVVGVIAGIFYGLLLVRQKKLWGVIVAHAVTNLGLGIYILATGSWYFW